jgi:hypothetical protein
MLPLGVFYTGEISLKIEIKNGEFEKEVILEVFCRQK